MARAATSAADGPAGPVRGPGKAGLAGGAIVAGGCRGPGDGRLARARGLPGREQRPAAGLAGTRDRTRRCGRC